MLTAITRAVSDSLPACALTYIDFDVIDVELARRQHRSYEARLARLGVRVCRLPARHELPDAVFVEDTALVLDDIAILLPMGSEARRKETESVEPILSHFRPIVRLVWPAMADGGDMLIIGSRVYVGRSARTNDEAIAQLAQTLHAHGYEVVPVAVDGCVHLKTGCGYAGDGVLLINPDWVDAAPFKPFELLPVPDTEPRAANLLTVDGRVLVPDSFARTRELLERRGLKVEALDVSEFLKAEAGPTCLSLLFDSDEDLPDTGELTLRLER